MEWNSADGRLREYVQERQRIALRTYEVNPDLLEEHVNQEDSFRAGGYGERQISELLQNAVDALTASGSAGTIEFRMAGGNLYCANEGVPFSEGGIRAVCHAFLSPKRDEESIGRFGLGFKSVLGVSDRPQIFSRSVSFEFNAPETAELFGGMAAPDGRVPLMRVPSLIDVDAATADDPHLAEMLTWASTVVKLPLMRDGARLRTELQEFKTQSLLFMKSVSRLNIVLTDRDGAPVPAAHRRDGDLTSGEVTLTGPNTEPTAWLYAEREYRPSEDVLKTLTANMARQSMTVSYAVPKRGQTELGELWAWFPLRDKTTARGIFNAPWQVNDDRTTLLATSALNGEMLEVCAELFLDVVIRSARGDDPAAHLDLFPARGREIRSAADRILTFRIPELARGRAIIPDRNGVLRARDHFRDVPSPEAPYPPFELMRAWQGLVDRDSIPHWSAYTTAKDRVSRLRTLLRDEDGKAAPNETTVVAWLEELGHLRTTESIAGALRIFRALRNAGFSEQIGSARIVPVEGGGWERVSANKAVLIPLDDAPAPDGVPLIDARFATGDVRELLEALGFSTVSTDQTAAALAARARPSWGEGDWRRLWSALLQAAPSSAARAITDIRERGIDVMVETASGPWRPAREVFASDAWAPTLATRHASDLHQGRRDLLEAAGALSEADPDWEPWREAVYSEYRDVQLKYVRNELRRNGHTSRQLGVPDIPSSGPLQILVELQDDPSACAGWTKALLKALPSRTATVSITLSSSKHIAEIPIDAPDWWAIQTYGRIVTTTGFTSVDDAVGSALRAYGAFLPAAESEVSMRLPLPRTLEEVPDRILLGALARSGQTVESDRMVTELVVEAAGRASLSAPDEIPAVSRGTIVLRRPADVVLASSAEDRAILDEHGVAYLDGSVEGADAIAEWGLRSSDEALARSYEIRDGGDAAPLTDRFPSLPGHSALPLGKVRLRRSPAIIRRVTTPGGTIEQRLMGHRYDDLVIVDDSLDDQGVLEEVSKQLGLGLSRSDIAAVLDADDQMRRNDLIARVRSAPTPPEKLLLLFGPAVLKQALPQGLLAAVEGKSGKRRDIDVAELYWRVRGHDSLWYLRDELGALKLPVPRDWAGSDQAQAFVSRLGFPTGYAGTKEVKRPALQQVLGRIDLKPLHDFQEQLAGDIRSHVLERSSDGEHQRGLLYLPTGAGKTRVTVEAVVRMLVADEIRGPVLWIAQSQELCEQAIQTWTDVWRAIGDERVLDLNRFWGDYELDESREELQVVVATDAKLHTRITNDERAYPWLAQAALVIIDEAHRAGTLSYTSILRWLGIVAGRGQASAKTARPLLGLTATPFRGRNPELNRLFAERFGNKKLESLDPEDPIGQLRRAEVLAEVDHYVLDGMSVDATDADVAGFRQMKDVTKSMLDRIGQDIDRTKTLVDDILTHDPSWPVLVFSASVASAHTIAALLTLEGASAAAVDGTMRPQERRRVIEDFRAGKTQVLVNCDLLTQGFDAPKVRALYIARPTFSPNRYHQMIGRGLRGPRNGGKERCLIVNVADTFEEFGEQLAFTEFNYLWETQNA
ncbi:sacsin N-terminal ATP-binding-like domain-containing protein [Agromyces sp. GXQ0307]|uniref:DEAD/DEAH box helicase n=1 Tax=Agromyces sp. GXQ0307 TaxID=3377835 RepID=UPI00383A0412